MATTKKLSATNLKATTTLNTTKVAAAAKTISTGVKQVSDIKISTVTEKKVSDTLVSSKTTTDKLFQFTSEAGVSKLELVGTAGLNQNDLKARLNERLQQIKRVPSPKQIFDEYQAILDITETLQTANALPTLTVQVSPYGGVRCTCICINRTTNFSCTLERKKVESKSSSITKIPIKRTTTTQTPTIQTRKPVLIDSVLESKQTGWTTVASSKGGFLLTDTNVEENCEYTYRLTYKNLSNNETGTVEKNILYEKLDVIVSSFQAKPDPVKKKVVLTYSAKNTATIKITRKDTGKEISSPYEDTDVELNKTYEYVLEASNYWESIKKETKVTCSNLTPSTGKLSQPTLATIEREVTLQWTTATNASFYSIERRLQGTEWNEIYSNLTACSWKDIDKSPFGKEEILMVDETYEYRVKYCNEWESAYSEAVSVKMTNKVPNTPRILPPDPYTLRWTQIGNAKEYYIERTDSPSKLNWLITGTINLMTDYDAVPGEWYTYKIVARNGWGESKCRYFDVKKPEQKKKSTLQNCYEYIGQKKCDSTEDCTKKGKKNWRNDLQGITTDGKRWYIANGCYPSYLTWAAVDRTLDRYISRDYTSPDDIHFGDLDYYKGYLFVPAYVEDDLTINDFYKDREFVPAYVEDENKRKDNPPQIWIFDTDCKLIEKCNLVKGDGSYFEKLGWCAVNPSDGRLYTSENYIESGSPLYSFKINLDKIKTGKSVFTDSHTLYLYDENGNLAIKEAMQGGCFDDYNNIYLNSGFGPKTHEGIHVFKLIRDDSKQLSEKLANQTDEACAEIYEGYYSGDLNLSFECTKALLIAKSSQEKNAKFKYQIDNNHKWFDPPGGKNYYVEEPEGLVYYDFSEGPVEPYHDNMKKSSLLVSLLHNLGGTDYAYLKSYVHLFRETEEKYISYNPANLKMGSVVETNNDGTKETVWKIVDNDGKDFNPNAVGNGILVKKFDSKDHANAALEILKNFEKIHTIGWLYTCSPNHNYEFSVLESNKTLSSSSCTSINYSNPTIIHEDESEFWKVTIKSTQGQMYHFRAHNEEDAKKILEILKRHSKLCYIGVGPDTNNRTLGRFRSANNLIWLE